VYNHAGHLSRAPPVADGSHRGEPLRWSEVVLGLHPFDEVVHQAVNGAQAHRRRRSQQIWLISGELVDEDEPLPAEAQALMVRLLPGQP
jgi:hypothetical protein